MAQREGMAETLATVIQIIEGSAKRQSMPTEEAASLLRTAIYPYSLT
jgi:hypothetical protein